jgi:pyruvate dehydrogenase E1 component
VIAVSDFVRAVPDQVARWFPGRFFSLGTDGFGRSDTREALRRFFNVDAEVITTAALHQLARAGQVDPRWPALAVEELGVDPDNRIPPCAERGRGWKCRIFDVCALSQCCACQP